MSGGMFLIDNDGRLVDMNEEAYDSEDFLQGLLARDVGQVRDVLRKSDTTDDAGSRRVFATVEEAVEAATTRRSGNTSQTSTQETP